MSDKTTPTRDLMPKQKMCFLKACSQTEGIFWVPSLKLWAAGFKKSMSQPATMNLGFYYCDKCKPGVALKDLLEIIGAQGMRDIDRASKAAKKAPFNWFTGEVVWTEVKAGTDLPMVSNNPATPDAIDRGQKYAAELMDDAIKNAKGPADAKERMDLLVIASIEILVTYGMNMSDGDQAKMGQWVNTFFGDFQRRVNYSLQNWNDTEVVEAGKGPNLN